jgi:hypothetical protein
VPAFAGPRVDTIIYTVCTNSTFATDASALRGQETEVQAYYNATGNVCKVYSASWQLLYDPSS